VSRWLSVTAPDRPPSGAPALFLDRDGVLMVEKDYVDDPDLVELVPGVPAALRQALAAGWLLIGVSNQSGLGRGRFTMAQFTAVMTRLDELLAEEGCPLHGFFYCPHAPDEGCRCRKPSPGLLAEAGRHYRWDPARSWVVGDKVSDVDLALDAGLQPALVRTGHGVEQEALLGRRQGVLVADDLPAVVVQVLAREAP
jgi:histidinol-phosphate phosphatase family protein